jgi:hypothetical protein
MKISFNGNTVEILEKDIKEVRNSSTLELTGYLWNNQNIPLADGNVHYELIKSYIEQGGAVLPAYTVEESLELERQKKIAELETYCNSSVAKEVTVIRGDVTLKLLNDSEFRKWLQTKALRYLNSTDIINYDITDSKGNILGQVPFVGNTIKECFDKFEDQAQNRYNIYKTTKTSIMNAEDLVILSKIVIKTSAFLLRKQYSKQQIEKLL